MFDEINDVRKQAFLNAFVTTGSISEASLIAGNERTTVWYWRRDDEQFTQAFLVAEEIYNHNYLNELQQELKKRSLDPKAPMSTVALFFALKAEAPDKYREKPLIDKAIIGDVTIKLALPEREYPQIEGDFKVLEGGGNEE